jgi:hypothetical protein
MNCANHPDRERVAFCQNCGKPLCQECTRAVGSAVFCEPCLAAKLAGVNNPPDSPYPPSGGTYANTGNESGVNYTISGAVPPPPSPDAPNPSLAALLGFIPGVGAMYNGQYAKGVVHLIVFAILVSLSSENGIFGLFVAGWLCYQVIEAHQTARARRDGTPLPNPFGLNDLGERLGFGKAWPGAAPSSATPPTDPAAASTGTYTPPNYPPSTPPPASNWGSPWHWENHVPPTPPPYGTPVYPVDPNTSYPHNRFPAGAIWLIGLGAIFLIGNTGLFHGFSAHWFVPFLLIGFGVWQFVRKMTEYGAPLADDGSAAYRFRLFHALRSSIWIMLVGLLFLLDSFHILSWSRSWPLFIIVAGLMAIFQRAAFTHAASAPYPYTPTPATPAPAPPPVTASVVPSDTHDQEGS